MKIFKRIISIVIWTVIALNLLSAGLLHLPGVQQFLGGKVSALLEEQLGTKVSVGQIDLGLLNRIIIDDILIYDQQRQEMLRVSRLAVKIDYMPLTEGKIHISSAQLFGAHAHLYRKDAQTAPNFQFVIDSLASKDTTKQTPLDLRINTFIIRNSSVTYDQHDMAPTDGLFNLAHLKVKEISGHINLKTLTDDSLNINVKRLGFKDHSGLTIRRLGFHLAAGRKDALLENFQLQMPSSNLRIDTLLANYQLNEKGLVPGSLTFSGVINNTSITPSDLRCFEPSLKNFQRPVMIATSVNGTDQMIHVPELLVSTTEKDIDINVNGWLEHWDKQPAWHLQVNQFTLSEASKDFLNKIIKLPDDFTRIGNLQLTGTFDRDRQGETTLKALLQSGAGDIDVEMAMDAARRFNGTIGTQNLDLKKILDNDQLGQATTHLTLEGEWPEKQKPTIKVDGAIERIDYKDYPFGNINISGNYEKEAISAKINIDDPHLSAQLDGEVTEDVFEQNSQKAKHIKLQGSVAHFAPTATHLTDQFGNTELSGQIDADFTAQNLNNAQGVIRISNFVMTGTEQHKPYYLDNLTLSSGYDEGIHFLSLKSDFADAELKGQFDYNTLVQSFVNLIGSKLPTLPGLPPLTNSVKDNNFSIRLLMSKTDWLKRFFDIDLELGQPLALTATINDFTRQATVEGDLPSFAYNGSWYSNGYVHVTSPADTLKCDLGIQKLMDDGKRMTIGLQANASNNIIRSSLNWDDHSTDQHMGGRLNCVGQLYKDLMNKPAAHVRIQPSHIILNNGTWDVEPSDVLYSEDRLLVDHFAVHQGKQHIIIDGIASRLATDTLTADLQSVEIGYILDLVNFHSVEFSGKASGRAKGTSLFSDFSAQADLCVDDFKFEKGRMGVLNAHANWNKEKEQIDIHAIANDGPDVKTLIDGFVSPIHETIDLAIHADGTYIDFMQNFTYSFLSDVTGHADGDCRVAGTLDNINLTGKLVVDGEATVIPLNTTYTLKRDTVVMIPDDIRLNRIPIYDREGNEAFLSGGIHHQHLTNLSFDLAVDTEKLLAYDFHEFGDNLFYGTVYASGLVTIHGVDNEVVIDCNVTPLQNSIFVYNASSPDAISTQEFIEWEKETKSTSGLAASTHKAASPTRALDTDIYINFLINATPEAALRLLMDANTYDYITLYGDGAIRATFHNKGAFNMFGTYTVDHGTYGITIQNIIKKNFTFNQGGTIIFGGDPYQAALNLQAVYTVNGVSLSDLNIGNSFTNNSIRVNCLMNISGQPMAPQVDFDLEMPNVNTDEQQMVRSIINGQQEMNQQVVYLLAIGRFYNQGVNNSNNQQSDQTTLAMQSFLSGTLSTQINTLLSQIVKNDNWNFGANISTGNEGWHNAEYEGIINGRMLNNRLLFNGQFGYRDNATKANPSFIGDFDLQYLLYPNGNLALKVYNQTNDRYFTKSSLNTQGIGIIMKKDFNGLSELFSTKKKKKKSTASNIKEDHSQQH